MGKFIQYEPLASIALAESFLSRLRPRCLEIKFSLAAQIVLEFQMTRASILAILTLHLFMDWDKTVQTAKEVSSWVTEETSLDDPFGSCQLCQVV